MCIGRKRSRSTKLPNAIYNIRRVCREMGDSTDQKLIAMKSLLFLHLTMGPLLLATAMIMKVFPPRKINGFYGYRTPRSMRSLAAWREANAFCANAMIVLVVSISCFQLATYLLLDHERSLLWSAGSLVVGLIVVIVITERHLKTKGFN